VSAAVVAAPPSPYKGLAAFDDSDLDALFFFGRERESEVIAANLMAARLTVLYGPSGVGKSSVLRAGAARRLLALAPDVKVVVHDAWAGEPVTGLLEAVARSEPDLAPPPAGAPLADALADWTRRRRGELYLVLDQFEELFVYHQDGGALTEELARVVNRPGLAVNVLIAIREDALAELDVFTGRIPNVFGNYLPLDRLDRAAGRAAILGPLERYNSLVDPDAPVEIEPELVDVVLDEVAAGRVALGDPGKGAAAKDGGLDAIEAPFLQLVMERLWEAETGRGARVLRRSTLSELGGAEAIVRAHLERAVGALAPAQRDVAARIFNHLVTPSGTKIAHRVGDLADYAHVPEDELRPVLARLGEERVLRPLDGRFEIFHDVLAGAVVTWRQGFEAQRELARERGRRRRARLLAAVALVGMALMTAVAVYAFSQRSEAREQAALARTEQAEARRQAERAEAKSVEARRNLEAAKRQEGRAERGERAAEEAAALAKSNATRAEQEAARAQEQGRVARSQEAIAQTQKRLARRNAQQATLEARRAKASARLATREQAKATRAVRREQAGKLTAQALANIEVDPVVSVEKALAAARLRPSPEVENALRRSLLALRVRVTLPGGGGPIAAAEFSPDGSRVVVAADREARIFRVRDAKLLHRLPHRAGVSAATFSRDGRLLATASPDGAARLWNADTGTLIRALRHSAPVEEVAFSGDGRFLATGGRDGGLRVWDAATGLELWSRDDGSAIKGISVSPDGTLALTFTIERTARVREIASGRPVASLEQSGEVTDALFGPDGRTVVTTGRRNVYVWETGTWERRHLLEGHVAAIRDAAYSPDGTSLVTVGIDGVGRVWDVQRGDLVNTLAGHRAVPSVAAFSPDGESIVTGAIDRTARIWVRARVGALPLVLAGHESAVTTVAYSPDGGTVLTGSRDGTARLWDSSPEDPAMSLLGKHRGAVTVVAATPDSRFAISAGNDGTARVWPIGRGSARVLEHGGRVVRAILAPGGTRVLTVGDDGFARLWHLGTAAKVAEFRHGRPIAAAAISPSGNTLVTAGDDGVARVWSTAGPELRVLSHGAPLTAVRFSPDGSVIATGASDGSARLWNARSGAELAPLVGHRDRIVAITFSPNGRRVATASADTTARLWDVPSGRAGPELAGHAFRLTSVVFSRDGRIVLTAGADGEARTWRAVDGKPVITFTRHVSTVADARYSPDGRWVVTAGPSAVGLWRAATSDFVFFLRGEAGPYNAVLFTRDGRWILAGSTDGSVRAYRCVICARVPELRRMAQRKLEQLARRNAAAAG